MPQFFSTAVAPRLQQHADASSGPAADTDALLQQFADRQELAENEQDLVLYRMCYFFQQEKRHSTNETKEAVISTWKTHQKQQPQQGGADASLSPAETVLGIQQVYVTFWPAICLAGMIYILLQFVVFYRGKGNGIDGVAWTEESMTKHTAMLLCFAYAALAWTLSNGLVLNPKKDVAGLCT